MSEKVKALSKQARELSSGERIALVEDVLDSLDRADPNIDRLWAEEARDRLAAYRRGELATVELGDVVAKAGRSDIYVMTDEERRAVANARQRPLASDDEVAAFWKRRGIA